MFRSCPSDHARRGFTLVELLVSIAIVGMIAGLSLANFHSGQQSSEMRLSTELLVTQIRALQTSSYGGRLVSVCSTGPNDKAVCESGLTCQTPGVCQKRVPTGYGIHFNAGTSKTYTLFYDTDGDKKYSAREKVLDESFISTNNVVMLDLSGLPLDLVYTPPYGQLYINGAASGPILVTLTLNHPNGRLTKHVNVYRLSGKVDHD